MFIRQKIINGTQKFYLVENTRRDGKVRQKVLAYLGNNTSLEGAIVQQRQKLASTTRPEAARRIESRLQKLESLVVPKRI
jgi:hypothetical protein